MEHYSTDTGGSPKSKKKDTKPSRSLKMIWVVATVIILCGGAIGLYYSQTKTNGVKSTIDTAPRIEFKETEITKRTDTKYNCPEYTVYPADIDTDNIVWTSTDESVAKIEYGMLYTGNEGTAQLIVTLDDNISASVTVNVEKRTKKSATSPYNHSSSGSSSTYTPRSSWTTGGPGASSTERGTGKSSGQEYQNALTKGLQYANRLHMSKKAVYNQLISSYGEGFSADAAQYAIDNMTSVDWNANALAKAKEYYYSMPMSKSAVYDQLTSEYGEQFTASQAQYAVDHLD